ncbi:hypothetical protein [Blastococcus xanthinilyticus]|uniref:Uncharacterized protein n=1 Tax=Blastococcus xanthinilyticus TaxID=1564164 RepID=A0A5S5CMD7_9ACTN|nr:hypothetical protein [Blastococcus xanthinilyticus]TYP82082.1 hypothetical protein BD833_12066 [Blastococcus xanthinilyticus]
MSFDTAQILGTTLPAAGAGLIGWLTYRLNSRKHRTDGAQQMIDQAQEERDKAWERADADRERMDALLANALSRIGGLEVRERVLLDYVAALRHHIDQRNEPPPPPWPDALTH